METFYFTYGLDGYPFVGGWTEIVAPDKITAIRIFRSFHPDREDGFMNCAFVYDSETFRKTSMYKTGNFGARCHELIVAEVEEGPFDE